jgi:cytochrome c oxidase subunit 2
MAATSTGVVNGALIYILTFSVLILFGIVFTMAYFVVRYRKSRNPVPAEIPGNRWLEALWIILPTVLALSMFVYGLTGFNFLRNAPSDSITVKVHARQWSWLFEYGNGKKSPDMVVPLGKNVRCELTSDDVIHGFYVPAFRIQQDTVPGITTQVWFNATSEGSYDILCSQYCGLKHSDMAAKLLVVSPARFDDWLKGETIPLPGVALTATNEKPGQALLRERGCVSCHSVDGGPMVGPTFKGLFGSRVRVITDGKKRIVAADEAYLQKSILDPGADIVEGYPNIMPPGKDVFSSDELHEVLEYLEGLR